MRRESRRALAARPVECEKLRAMLEAARWAPSYGNMQPWRFVLVQEPAALDAMRPAFTPGNAWAKQAPVLVVGTANPQDAKIVAGKEYYLFDLGLAVQNLLLQAVACGLVAHPMGGWDEQTVKQALGVPDEVRVVVVIALGYPGRLEELDEETRRKEQQPRTRKALAEIAFADRWGRPWDAGA
ncbi:MAG: nitroreductase family protein [Chloroflexi bacterium]|nr:nitroreductase family protein [Chloroflexota bacterium]